MQDNASQGREKKVKSSWRTYYAGPVTCRVSRFNHWLESEHTPSSNHTKVAFVFLRAPRFATGSKTPGGAGTQ